MFLFFYASMLLFFYAPIFLCSYAPIFLYLYVSYYIQKKFCLIIISYTWYNSERNGENYELD